MKLTIFLYSALVAAQAVSLPESEDDCVEYGIAEREGFDITFFDAFFGDAGSLPSASNWLIDTGVSYPGGVSSNLYINFNLNNHWPGRKIFE